jgi:hypothetical protein
MLRLCLSQVLQAGVTVFGHDPQSITSAISRHRHLAVVPHPSLACGMVNRFPCLESHRD